MIMRNCRTVASELQAAIALSQSVLLIIIQQISSVFLNDIVHLTTVLKKYCVLQVGTVFQ